MLKHIIDGRGHIQTVSVPGDPVEEMNALIETMRFSEQMGRDAWLKTLDPEFARSIEYLIRRDGETASSSS